MQIEPSVPGFAPMNGALLVLQCLHVFWFTLIIKVPPTLPPPLPHPASPRPRPAACQVYRSVPWSTSPKIKNQHPFSLLPAQAVAKFVRGQELDDVREEEDASDDAQQQKSKKN